MDKLGLSPAEFRIYRRALHNDHARKVELHVLALDDNSHLSSLTSKVLDGQVAYDVTADVTRMADIRFADPQNSLGFEPDDPSDAPLHRSRLLRVVDSRYVAELGDWIDCPVITGPGFDFQRDGSEVEMTVHGMERQALAAVWDKLEFTSKTKITDAMRKVLAAVGDVNAVVPDLPHTFPKRVVIHPFDQAWPHIQKFARALDRVAFYDGSGRFHLRPLIQRPVYEFRPTITSHVVPKRTVEGFINTVVVLGPNPDGPKHRIRGTATLRGSLSPSALSRHGVPLREPKVVEVHHLKTKAQALRKARRILLESATTRTDLSFSSMPVPMLEEMDMVGISDDSFGHARMRMRQWSLPLTGGDVGGSDGEPMTVGSIKRTTRAKVSR